MSDTTLKMLLVGEDRASGALNKVARSADDTHKSVKELGSGFAEAGAGMSKVMTIAGAAGPAVMAIGAALSSAAAGGTALIGAVGPAAAGGLAVYAGALLAVKQASAVAQFAMAGVSEAAAGDEKAMAKLSPAGQKLAKDLHDLKPEIDGVRAASQAGMFPGVEGAVASLARNYMPLLKTAARETGKALGDLALDGAKMVSTGPWRADFATVTKGNAQNLGLMGQAGLNLANVARNLFVTAMPLIHMFLQWAVGATGTVSAMSDAGRESGKLAAFWDKAAQNGATLGHILGNLGAALGHVFSIGAGGTGTQMLKTVEGLTAEFRAWTTSANGAESIAKWFDQGRDNLGAMGRLVHDVMGGMKGIGSGAALAPLIDQIRTQVIPPLMQFLHNASASGALGALVTAVGKVVQVFADLSASDGSLKAFAKTLGFLADSALFITENVPGASTALAAFFTVAGASAALKFAGLGGVLSSVSSGLVALTTRLLAAAGAETTETGAVTLNTLAHQASHSTIGTWLGVKALEAGAWIKSAAGTVAHTAALVANRAVTLAVAAASKVWAAGQWALNAALDANPIGLVVIAIAALVAGIIYAYKHSETFRKIVDAAFHAIGVAGKWLWDNALKPAFEGIKKGMEAVGRAGTWLWNNALQPAFRFIVAGVATMLEMWARMLSTLGRVPGFGWAKTASQAMHNAAQDAGDLANGIKKIPDSSTTRISTPGMDGARAGVHDLWAYLTQMPRYIQTQIVTQHVDKFERMTAGHNAQGTTSWRGGLTWVGERGPELVELPTGSAVHSNQESRRMAGGGSSGSGDQTLAVNLNLDGKRVQQVLLKVKRDNGGLSLGLA